MKTLVLVTKPVDSIPKAMARIVLGNASEVALIQNGVYNTPEKVKKAGIEKGSARWRALDVDVEARRMENGFELLSYSDIVEAIEKNDTVITL